MIHSMKCPRCEKWMKGYQVGLLEHNVAYRCVNKECPVNIVTLKKGHLSFTGLEGIGLNDHT